MISRFRQQQAAGNFEFSIHARELLKSRPVKHVKHRIINSNFLPEVFRYDQTSASFLQSYHGSHTSLNTSVPKILSKLSWKFAHGCWKSSAGSSLWTPGPTKADRNSCNVKLVQEGRCRWTNSWFGQKGLSPHLAKLPRHKPFGWSSAVLAFGPLMSGKQCEIVR